MGESPAAYEHADAVMELTERIRAEYPAALDATLEYAPALIDAIDESKRTRSRDPLTIFVAVFQHLTTSLLSHLPDADTVANEIITAALYEANGIDWAATSVQVTQPQPGTYQLCFSFGGGSSAGSVPAPRPSDRHPFSPDPHLDTDPYRATRPSGDPGHRQPGSTTRADDVVPTKRTRFGACRRAVLDDSASSTSNNRPGAQATTRR